MASLITEQKSYQSLLITLINFANTDACKVKNEISFLCEKTLSLLFYDKTNNPLPQFSITQT